MRINQDDDPIDAILLFWIIENCDYLKIKRNNER